LFDGFELASGFWSSSNGRPLVVLLVDEPGSNRLAR